MPRAALALAALLIALLALAGCGGDDDKQVGLSEATYTVELPEGWSAGNDAEKEAAVAGAGSVAEDAGDRISITDLWVKEAESGFATNVNVVRELVPTSISLDDYLTAGKNYLESAGASGVKIGESRELDGDEAATIEYRNPAGPEIANRAVIAVHDDSGYVVTFTAPVNRVDDETTEFDQILDSWQWE